MATNIASFPREGEGTLTQEGEKGHWHKRGGRGTDPRGGEGTLTQERGRRGTGTREGEGALTQEGEKGH